MRKLKLGIIGLSEGNGHPYSWAAIFNGYKETYMRECPFPVILDYLSNQTFPQDAISDAQVTYIWTQNRKISEHVANASNIQNVVKGYTELIGKVDAVLLARDDAENHYEMSKEFLKAGIPIYIDKPLAYNRKEAEKIYELEQYEGQIFTCSALKYAKEFHLSREELAEIGNVKYIEAVSPKDWRKYSVHIIEPVIKTFCNEDEIVETKSMSISDKTFTTVLWRSGLITNFSTLGNIQVPIKITIRGEKGTKELLFEDTFFAFKKALEEFVKVIQTKNNSSSKNFVMKVLEIIEVGENR